MAGVNQVFSLADVVARYVKACGKRSILQTKPLQGKINPKELGARLSDGSISFANQETAIEYGIERCRQALIAPNPFERAVNIKGRRVVAEIQGTADSVNLHNRAEVMIHGHPDTYEKGCTTALSTGDYEFFIEHNCIKRMMAVNSKGEFYQMVKKPDADFSIYSKNIGALFEELNYRRYIPEQADNLPMNRLPKWLVDNSHKFWMEQGKYCKVIISTNFSNFINPL